MCRRDFSFFRTASSDRTTLWAPEHNIIVPSALARAKHVLNNASGDVTNSTPIIFWRPVDWSDCPPVRVGTFPSLARLRPLRPLGRHDDESMALQHTWHQRAYRQEYIFWYDHTFTTFRDTTSLACLHTTFARGGLDRCCFLLAI